MTRSRMAGSTRISGSDGLVGTWRASKVKGGGGPQEFVISVPAAGMVHYNVPDMKVNVEGRTDGSDIPLTGPTVPPDATISFKALTPTKMRYVMKIGGKTDPSIPAMWHNHDIVIVRVLSDPMLFREPADFRHVRLHDVECSCLQPRLKRLPPC